MRVAGPCPDIAVAIRGQATLAAPYRAIDGLRDAPAPAGVAPLPPRFLRHADEQTVVGVQTVLAAVGAARLTPDELAGASVVAAPCRAGRVVAARTLAGWHARGAVAVSPHVVPHCSLHAMASAVSVVLGCHGPHLGVGGGTGAVAEALSLLPWLTSRGAGGIVLLVTTGWDADPRLATDGTVVCEPVCRAVAAVVVRAAAGGFAITLAPGRAAGSAPADDACRALRRLAELVSGVVPEGQPGDWSFAGHRGCVVRVTRSVSPLREAA